MVHVVASALEPDDHATNEGAEVRVAADALGKVSEVDGEVGAMPEAIPVFVVRYTVLIDRLILDTEVQRVVESFSG